MLAAILEAPFYGDLRTKQQLGYIVSSGVKQQKVRLSFPKDTQTDTQTDTLGYIVSSGVKQHKVHIHFYI